ncbi:hypothetical protein CPC08DRAFT_823102 [Agrocybe pediades]|nr:hypothetical protein CPC08DRAFT_823102 [Agrocybe pediades]
MPRSNTKPGSSKKQDPKADKDIMFEELFFEPLGDDEGSTIDSNVEEELSGSGDSDDSEAELERGKRIKVRVYATLYGKDVKCREQTPLHCVLNEFGEGLREYTKTNVRMGKKVVALGNSLAVAGRDPNVDVFSHNPPLDSMFSLVNFKKDTTRAILVNVPLSIHHNEHADAAVIYDKKHLAQVNLQSGNILHSQEKKAANKRKLQNRKDRKAREREAALALPATQSDTGNENDSHVEDGVQAATPSEQTSASTPFTMEYFEMRMAEERREREEAVGGLQSENFQLSERVRLLEKSNVKLEKANVELEKANVKLEKANVELQKANVELRQRVGELERQNERKHQALGSAYKAFDDLKSVGGDDAAYKSLKENLKAYKIMQLLKADGDLDPVAHGKNVTMTPTETVQAIGLRSVIDGGQDLLGQLLGLGDSSADNKNNNYSINFRLYLDDDEADRLLSAKEVDDRRYNLAIERIKSRIGSLSPEETRTPLNSAAIRLSTKKEVMDILTCRHSRFRIQGNNAAHSMPDVAEFDAYQVDDDFSVDDKKIMRIILCAVRSTDGNQGTGVAAAA